MIMQAIHSQSLALLRNYDSKPSKIGSALAPQFFRQSKRASTRPSNTGALASMRTGAACIIAMFFLQIASNEAGAAAHCHKSTHNSCANRNSTTKNNGSSTAGTKQRNGGGQNSQNFMSVGSQNAQPDKGGVDANISTCNNCSSINYTNTPTAPKFNAPVAHAPTITIQTPTVSMHR
jgi:hypothetical protein